MKACDYGQSHALLFSHSMPLSAKCSACKRCKSPTEGICAFYIEASTDTATLNTCPGFGTFTEVWCSPRQLSSIALPDTSPWHMKGLKIHLTHLSVWPMQAWEVIHLIERGTKVVVDTGKVFAEDVMNGVKVLMHIEGQVVHYIAQVLPWLVSIAS